MQAKSQNTAVLIFANSAAEDSRIKKIASDSLLFEILTQKTIQTVKATGLPYFLCTEHEQKGTTFGERFTNAIEVIFEKGFEQIITIGNDTPQLKTRHLLTAKTKVESGQSVLGPSSDGGFYLMGIHRSHFDKSSFLELPWQHFKLFQQTEQLFSDFGACIFRLPTLNDLDSEKDILLLVNFTRSISKSILDALRTLLKKAQIPIQASQHLFSINPIYFYYNKGSPLLSN